VGSNEHETAARGPLRPAQLAMIAAATVDPLGLYRVEGADRYRHEWLDPRALDAIGFERIPLADRLFDEVFPPEVAARFHDAANQAVREGRTVRYLGTTPHEHGLRDLEVTLTPVFADGVTQLVTSMRDVSDRMALEREREAADRRLRKLMEHAPDMIWLIGADGTIVHVTQAIVSLLGYRPDEVVGRHSVELAHPDGVDAAVALRPQVWASSAGEPFVGEMLLRHRDGSARWVECTFTNLVDDPDIGAIVVNSHDVTERKLVEQRLAHEALHDSLTGLPNRVLVSQRIDSMIAVADGIDRLAAVLYVDFDGFKLINDTYGHDQGDAMIRAAARRLERTVGSRGWVARLGGDEFIVVSSQPAPIEHHLTLAADIRTSLSEPFHVASTPIYLTASMGLATTCGTVPLDADEMLRRADMAMYEAKRHGHNTVQVFDESLSEKAARRLEHRNGLRRAIDEQQFRLEYQPIVTAATGRITGVEALLRWDRPTGVVMPAEFIEIAEDTGLIVPIGDWVVDEVCRQLADWARRGLGRVHAAVNVSPKQLLEPDFVAKMRASIAKAGVAPTQLVVEITENLLVEDPTTSREVLRQLASFGIGISIDDFGMGYSSLSYLSNLPATILKIDRTFIAPLAFRTGEDELNPDTALVGAIIGMAHALGLEVVAEGVETEAQIAALRRLGCDHAQGYHLGRPAPPANVEARLRAARDARPEAPARQALG
jgi:diguanylate cyclase (GGDEF)-like protein/PAS domain S-box-containing protein